MTKLTELQTTLLSTAAQRDNGSIYPLPDAIADAPRAAKALATLRNRGYVEEREIEVAADLSRSDGDRRYGLYVTAAGLTAIGIDDHAANNTDDTNDRAPAPAERKTKISAVLDLLERDSGATLAELIEATGWLPHTTRAALTGLRKKGHLIERGKRGDDSCYSVRAAA